MYVNKLNQQIFNAKVTDLTHLPNIISQRYERLLFIVIPAIIMSFFGYLFFKRNLMITSFWSDVAMTLPLLKCQ